MSLRRNTIWNLAGNGLPLLLGLAAIPYLVQRIGVEAFGILTLIWTLIGYFSLFDFGLGRALTQQVAASLAAGRIRRLPQLVRSGLRLTALTGLLGGVMLAAAAHPLGHGWLNVSQPLQAETTVSLLIAALGIPLTTVSTGLRGVLEAYEDFKTVNLLRMALGCANFGLPVLSVFLLGSSLVPIVTLLIAARAVVLAAFWLYVNRRMPARWLRAQGKAHRVRHLLSFGIWSTVSNVISPLMVSADRFLISAMLGAAAVAYYTVPMEVLQRMLILPGALTGVLFPRLASTLRREPLVAHMLYRRSLYSVALVMAAACAVIGLGAHAGLALWLGDEFADRSWVVVSILSAGIFLNSIAFVPFAAIQAAGDARTTARFHLFELVVYIPLLAFMVRTFGLEGAAVAWVLRVGLDLYLLVFLGLRRRFPHWRRPH